MIKHPYISNDDFALFMQGFGVQDKIAVGVSGGADSLSLCVLLKDWCDQNNVQLTALTFDHGLRPEAADEAAYVADLLKQRGIAHHTLKADQKIGDTKIQETARNFRYTAMEDYCQHHGIKTLAVAHHVDDQYETFFMRLARGSGLKGLGGMSNTRHTGTINIIRPLLRCGKDQILETAKHYNLEWIEDPSNQDDKYTRIQFRKARKQFDDLGLNTKMVEKTRAKLAAAESYIEYELNQILSQVQHSASGVELNLTIYDTLHPYMKKRLVSHILTTVGQSNYAPKSQKVEGLIDQISRPDFKSATLNTCLVRKTKEKTLEFSPEI